MTVRTGPTVDAARLWVGGAAAALVAALVVLVGVVFCRGVLDIQILAPDGEGVWGGSDAMLYALGAAVAALLATGLMHLLLLWAPRPYRFFTWVVTLTTLLGVFAPFAVDADRDSQVAAALLNLLLGISIGALVSGVARSAVISSASTPGWGADPQRP